MRSPFAVVLVLACCARESVPESSTKLPPASGPDAPSDAAPAAALTGYPWARLVVADNPVEPLPFALPEATLAELGVKSHRSFTATRPQVWLLAFEFADQAALLAAEPRLLAQLDDGAPYYPETATTGAWLLVTGFPGDEPVSPQMQRARTEFRSRWAGNE